ncbi:MAG: VWA domain-containing protein, partial [Myxococcales bacterium]|nr:VWA domain-containing protein [Myxococcales bacterium]
ELVVPASVAERYQVGPKPDGTWPSLEEAPPEPRSTRRVAPRLPLGYPWRVIRGLSVTVAAPVPIVTPTSPSHRVHPAADADGSFTFEHVETDELPRDFVLHWRLGGDGLSTGALVYDAPDGERFFLATVAPPAQVADEEPVLPRDYVFVVDVSGSMRGWPLDKARRLMKRLVSDLRPSDRFNVVTFAGAAGVLSPTALAPTAANVARACDDLDALAAGGGTELVAALRTALALPTSEGLVRTVVLVTDGFIDAERDAFELIRAHRGEMNLFAFGVGDSPNRFLLEGVARAGGGEPFVVASEADPDDVGARFRAVARAPLLTDVTVDFEGVDAYDVVPASEQLPTVYASRPLLVIGKLRAGDQAGLVRFRGRAASGPWEAVVDLADARRGPELEALRTLWARERVAELSDGGGSGDDAARREAIVTIGLHYGLLTEHTSFVAVDPRVRTAPGAPGTVVVPQPIPGVSVGQSGGGGMILGVMSGSGGGAFGGGTGVGGGGGGISGVVGSSGPIGPIGSGQGFGKIDNGGGASVAPAVSVTIVRLTVVGGLDEAVARRVLMMKRAMMAHVYRRILYKRPDVRGKVAVELTIAPTGRVTRAKVVPGASADAELASDVARMLNRIAFPKADQGTVVTVVYVFGPPRR